MTRPQLLGIALCCLVAAAMVAWPLLGNPPYGFYAPMKWAVAVSSLASAYVCFHASPYAWPLSLLLVLSAGVGLLGKMSRQDWVPFNWASLVLLVAAVAVVSFVAFRQPETEPETDIAAATDNDF